MQKVHDLRKRFMQDMVQVNCTNEEALHAMSTAISELADDEPNLNLRRAQYVVAHKVSELACIAETIEYGSIRK